MKSTQEELQNQIENGLVNESDDAHAYQRVFDALKKEPDFHVSLPFADRIVAIIEKKEEKRDYWWMAIGIFLAMLAMVISLALTSPHWTAGVFKFISSYSSLVVFGIACIVLLQWVDRKVIKKRLILK